MADKLHATIDLRAYWHCGTGSGITAHHDAVVARDGHGLPVLPARTLRGLLRDAVRQLERFGHAAIGSADALFGEAGFGSAATDHPIAYRDTQPGLLFVDDGRIDADLRGWMAASLESQDGKTRAEKMRAELFQTLSFTAIDRDTGTAREASLRMIEVVIPLQLSAEIGLARLPLPRTAAQADAEGNWRDVIGLAVNLVRGVGSHRSRGLGRCIVSVSHS